MFIIVIISFFVTFIISAFLVGILEERSVYSCKNKPILKFKDFQKYYYLNPDSWLLTTCTVCKNYEEFTFSFFGLIQYKIFRVKKEKEKKKLIKQERDRIAYIKLLESVQDDIDYVKRCSDKEIDKSTKAILQVINLNKKEF